MWSARVEVKRTCCAHDEHDGQKTDNNEVQLEIDSSVESFLGLILWSIVSRLQLSRASLYNLEVLGLNDALLLSDGTIHGGVLFGRDYCECVAIRC